MVIAHGVCVGDWGRFNRWVVPSALGGILALSGQTSIGDAYNTILDAAAAAKPDLLILQHDDLEITDPHAADKLAATMTDDVAVAGVAGACGVESLAWWNYDSVGHQQTDTQLIDFGPRTGDVDGLEGSLLVFSPWAIQNLRFDPLPGFHGYDVIICKKALARGKRVVVADVDTHHHVNLGFKTAASEAQWRLAEQYFQAMDGVWS